jgi:hypothetical protein
MKKLSTLLSLFTFAIAVAALAVSLVNYIKCRGELFCCDCDEGYDDDDTLDEDIDFYAEAAQPLPT